MGNMEKEKDYIHIMVESLQKKKKILSQIIEMNKQQKILLQDANLSPEELEKNMVYKGNLVEQLNLLDSGFEKLFDRVRMVMQQNKVQYADEIRQMQELIKEITAQTNTIQTQEIRNREEATRKFVGVRQQVKGVRNSQKVVKQYYQNMMSQKNTMACVVDDKK